MKPMPIQYYLLDPSSGFVRKIKEYRPALGTEVLIRNRWYSASLDCEIVRFDPNFLTRTVVKRVGANRPHIPFK